MLHHQALDTNRLSRNTVYVGDPSVLRARVERGGRPAIEGACPSARDIPENVDVPECDIVVRARLDFGRSYRRGTVGLAILRIETMRESDIPFVGMRLRHPGQGPVLRGMLHQCAAPYPRREFRKFDRAPFGLEDEMEIVRQRIV